MSKQAPMKLFLPITSTGNRVFIVKEFSPLIQTEEPAITELENEINIHDAPFKYKNSTQNIEIMIRYYSHRTIQNISNN